MTLDLHAGMSSFFRGALAVMAAAMSPSCAAQETPSTCYGTTADGRLENGWQLPNDGANFRAYSWVAGRLGRTYVHSAVHQVVLEAYTALQETAADVVFVYGETGKKAGGEFKPHKTHRNGLSVDFMVPVRDATGASVALPTSVFNKWGYDLEFDADGQLDDLTIDALAIAEHLYQLHRAAQSHDVCIWRVIFDPALQPLLQASGRWEDLAANLTFSTRRSWVRHDEHYHVDFIVPCATDE
ncbi:MAG: penicillin-insensitive murein endopeptidase [Pseudomonadota bacterium]